jgi:hypothetical protein
MVDKYHHFDNIQYILIIIIEKNYFIRREKNSLPIGVVVVGPVYEVVIAVLAVVDGPVYGVVLSV